MVIDYSAENYQITRGRVILTGYEQGIHRRMIIPPGMTSLLTKNPQEE
jgi:hypothetical protein